MKHDTFKKLLGAAGISSALILSGCGSDVDGDSKKRRDSDDDDYDGHTTVIPATPSAKKSSGVSSGTKRSSGIGKSSGGASS